MRYLKEKINGLGSCGGFSPYRWSEVDTTAPGGVFRSRSKDQKRIRRMVRAAYTVSIVYHYISLYTVIYSDIYSDILHMLGDLLLSRSLSSC